LRMAPSVCSVYAKISSGTTATSAKITEAACWSPCCLLLAVPSFAIGPLPLPDDPTAAPPAGKTFGPVSGLPGGLVTHEALVLAALLGRQVGLLPAPDAVEAREGVQVSERVPLEALGEARLGRGPVAPQLGREVVEGLERDAQHRAGQDRDRDPQLLHLLGR